MSLLKKLIRSTLVISCCLVLPLSATIVQFKTSLGTFDVNLFDETTPKTVENFLSYVNAENYDNSVIHRVVPDFVVQGGGFIYDGSIPLSNVVAKAAVQNEPKLSNRRGTIAMAKLENQPNSATNQWFFNLADNHAGQASLDSQNGGFTVFGQISTQGLEIIDEIAKLPRFNLGGAATSMPLRNYTAADAAANKAVTVNNLVIIESIVVVDARVNSAAGLAPIPNNTASSGSNNTGTEATSSGAFNWLVWFLLPLALLRSHVGRWPV